MWNFSSSFYLQRPARPLVVPRSGLVLFKPIQVRGPGRTGNTRDALRLSAGLIRCCLDFLACMRHCSPVGELDRWLIFAAQTNTVRELFPTERAFAILNRAHPLTAVVVLHVDYPGLNEELLRYALGELQDHMPGMDGHITRSGRQWVMDVHDDAPAIPLIVHAGRTEHDYRNEVARLLNTSIDERGPMVRAVLYSNPGSSAAEIILAFHHSLVDSTVLRELLSRLLVFLGDHTRQIVRGADSSGTDAYVLKPVGGIFKTLKFIWSQVRDEFRFRQSGLSSPVPESSRNAVISMRFTESETGKILTYCREQAIALNSLLNAAILLATVRKKYHYSGTSRYRTMTFADLRPFVTPTPARTAFGCLITMLRFTLKLKKDTGLAEVARKLQAEISRAGRTGDILLFAAMAPLVAKLSLRSGSARMGNSALSFIGALDLKPQYDNLTLRDVSAYISNNRLGPEFSGFGKIMHGRIGLDCTYLTAETSEEQASGIMREVQGVVLSLCGRET